MARPPLLFKEGNARHLFALSFESPTAGTLMANPPFVGTSNPTYYNFVRGQTEQLFSAEGPVPANFYLQVFVSPTPVAVEAATWSKVKALYHVPVQGARRD